MIRRGDNSAEVKKWQAFLTAKGFLNGPSCVDGDFGPKTELATQEYQKSRGLAADGIVGPKTYAVAAKAGFDSAPVDPLPESSKLILVSAGHTNNPNDDRGAAANGIIEGVEAVRLRDRVAGRLRVQGLSVLEDGADGVNDPLRKALVLARRADTAIEIHFNAAAFSARGVEVLAKSRHRKLAQMIATGIADAAGLKLRGDRGYKPDNSGQHHRLAFCEAGGLVVEVCFLTNEADVAAYKRNFEAVAKAIAEALAN